MADTPGRAAPAYARAIVLGIVCGMRTMLGPTLITGLAPPGVKFALRLMALGELIVDKLPTTPNRIAPGPLVGRAVSGAIVGGIVCRKSKTSPWLGALLGGMGAVAGAYGGYFGRKALVERFHVPDSVVAIAEDTLAVSVGQYFSK